MLLATNRLIRISGIYLEAKRARRWDPDRECYLDPYGNIAIDHNTLNLEAIIKELKMMMIIGRINGGELETRKRKKRKRRRRKKRKRSQRRLILGSLTLLRS